MHTGAETSGWLKRGSREQEKPFGQVASLSPWRHLARQTPSVQKVPAWPLASGQ